MSKKTKKIKKKSNEKYFVFCGERNEMDEFNTKEEVEMALMEIVEEQDATNIKVVLGKEIKFRVDEVNQPEYIVTLEE